MRELASRLKKEGRHHDEVIKHCGYLLGQAERAGRFLSEISPDKEVGLALFSEEARLSFQQITLLAEEYVQKKPRDIIGLCWRGQLAYWARDKDLAFEYAERIWDETNSASAEMIQRGTTFFALKGEDNENGFWTEWGWQDFIFLFSNLGRVQAAWIDRVQPLAWAIVRRAFLRGNWDTSLLCSMMALKETCHELEPEYAPIECWCWLAQHWFHSEGSIDGSIEDCYRFWNLAFESLKDTTDPALAHNVIVAVLLGRLLDQDCYTAPISIQRVLEALNALHRRHPTMPNKERAALEMVSFLDQTLKLEHLTATAADRLAIKTALERLKMPTQPLGNIGPQLLDGMEGNLKSSLGEALWAKLSEAAKSEFKHGEFHYQFASTMEGEKGDFRSFVMAYSRGLLAEIQESLRGPHTRNTLLKREFRDQFGVEEHPEWGDILRYMDKIIQNAATALGKRSGSRSQDKSPRESARVNRIHESSEGRCRPHQEADRSGAGSRPARPSLQQGIHQERR